jgi:hypothetical protein
MRLYYRFSLALAILTGSTPALFAQGSPTMASRSELEAIAHTAESAGRSSEVTIIRQRLRNGDFQVGDRVLIRAQETGEGAFIGRAVQDTLLIKAGRLLPLSEPMGDLNLTGVLFSEASDSVSARYAKYLKNITVRITPLVRLSTSGAVGRPGYYYFPADSPLSDLITATGGQTSVADPKKLEIHRGTEVLWRADDVRTALASGRTIEQLGLQSGDELNVGLQKRNWLTTVLQGTGVILTLAVAISQLRRK